MEGLTGFVIQFIELMLTITLPMFALMLPLNPAVLCLTNVLKELTIEFP